MSRKPVILQWSMSSHFGWGVYALNIGLNWAQDDDVLPVFSIESADGAIVLDELRAQVLAPVIENSRGFRAQLAPYAGKMANIPGTVIHALGENMETAASAHGVFLRGESTLGVIFFTNTVFDTTARRMASGYEVIVCGSSWNGEWLEEQRLAPAVTVLQGIDRTLFHPAPRSGLYSQRFLVFSGGKLEYRKGQDIVLLAFKAFASRHPEALLVTAWHSSWPQAARTIHEGNSKAAPPRFDERGSIDVKAWAAANGVAPEQVLDVGLIPNVSMPVVLREMDVGVFTNRAEGGTNLVAMECMACGVPTILSANTGHLDLIAPDRCIALDRQRAVAPAPGTEYWGESDVDEIVEALERVWRDREAARAIGEHGARWIADLSWANQTRLLKDAILPYLA